MLRDYWLEILAAVAVVAFCAMFLATIALNPGAEFSGADTQGSAQVSQITRQPEDSFQPIVPQWIPPSGEIESALFALQAAVGGIIVGYVFGMWRGQRRTRDSTAAPADPGAHV
jgi:cobalt/nickel transport protein